jgi:hypothetical protein
MKANATTVTSPRRGNHSMDRAVLVSFVSQAHGREHEHVTDAAKCADGVGVPPDQARSAQAADAQVDGAGLHPVKSASTAQAVVGRTSSAT